MLDDVFHVVEVFCLGWSKLVLFHASYVLLQPNCHAPTPENVNLNDEFSSPFYAVVLQRNMHSAGIYPCLLGNNIYLCPHLFLRCCPLRVITYFLFTYLN